MNLTEKAKSYRLGHMMVIQTTGRMCILSLDSRKVVKECSIANGLQVKAVIKEKYEKDEEFVTIRTQNMKMGTVEGRFYLTLTYNSNCLLNICLENDVPHIDIVTIHTQQITCLSTAVYKEELYILTGSMDRTISVLVVRKSSLVFLGYIRHKFCIEAIRINDTFDVLAVAKAHTSVQVWSLEKVLDSKKKQLAGTREVLHNLEKCNIRGHTGFICDAIFIANQRVLSCGDDQTLKLWDLAHITNVKPPNKKKKLKK